MFTPFFQRGGEQGKSYSELALQREAGELFLPLRA